MLSIIISKGIIKVKMNTEISQTKICKKCGRLMPIEKFNLIKGQYNNPYYLNQCKECEYKRQREYLEKKNKIEFRMTWRY